MRLVHLITSVPVPQIQEQNVDLIKVIPQEQMSKRILEQFVGVPVPQIMEETVEVAKLIAQERIQQRTLEKTVNVPVLQIQEQIVAVVKALFLTSYALCFLDPFTECASDHDTLSQDHHPMCVHMYSV